jgi:radical SAM protein with 4Fe4S-binding SPASM domain
LSQSAAKFDAFDVQNLLLLYPNFCDYVKLHLVPNGSRLFRALPTAGREKPDTFNVNSLGTEILLNIDGTNSIRTLCEIAIQEGVKQKTSPSEAIHTLIELITVLLKNNYLNLDKEAAAVSQRIVISGSTSEYQPTHASIELTDYCNLTCKHCYRESSPQCQQFISSDSIFKWLSQFHEAGIAVIELTGGEPTAHPDFTRILTHSCNLFDLVAVISNGTLWTKEMLIAAQKNADQLMVQIDLDGCCAETHNALRGPNVFEKATATIKRLSELGVRCKVAMSVHGENIEEIVPTATLAHDLGAMLFSFSPVLQMGRGYMVKPIPPEKGHLMKEAAKTVRELYPKFLHTGEAMFLDLSTPGENCGAGWRGIVVGPDANVRACVMHNQRYLRFGNLNESTIDEVFKNIPAAKFKAIPPPNFEDCKGCMHLEYCGGCPARAVQAIEHHREKRDGFVCKWDQKYQALSVYAPNIDKVKARSSLRIIQ